MYRYKKLCRSGPWNPLKKDAVTLGYTDEVKLASNGLLISSIILLDFCSGISVLDRFVVNVAVSRSLA